MITVGLTGPWQECLNAVLNIQNNLPQFARAVLEEQGQFLADEIRKHIQNQSLPWEPLAQYTVQKKGHSKIYIEHGDLFESFDFQFTDTSSSHMAIFVAAGDGVNADGTSLKQVMVDNEFGTTTVPARPLIRPTYWDAADDLKNNWAESLEKFVKSGGVDTSKNPVR